MNQSKINSLFESIINIAIRAPINMVVNVVVFPSIFSQEITISQNILIVIIFTIISISTSYCIRRLFNNKSIYQPKVKRQWELKLNQQIHGFLNALELQTIGLARNAKQNMKRVLKGFIVAIYFQGVIVLLDGAKKMPKRFVLAVINGLVVILLILVFG